MRAKAIHPTALIEKRQIKLIHVLISAMEMTDDYYRGLLQHGYNVNSSKEMTYAQAEAFISYLQSLGEQLGYWDPKANRQKYNNLGQRPDMASPAQLRMIESVWSQVTRPETEDERDATLRAWLFRYFKVSDLRFIDTWAVSKVLHALKQMQQRNEQKIDSERSVRRSKIGSDQNGG